jgi:hypothetical protein
VIQTVGEQEARARESSHRRHAIARHFFGDVGGDLFRRRNVGVAFLGVPFLHLRDAASIERTRRLRVKPQRRVKIGDGAVVIPLLVVCVAPAVEKVRVFRLKMYRLAEIGIALSYSLLSA